MTGDMQAADKTAGNDNFYWDDAYRENRAMHGFSIPAYTYKSCKCGQIWMGPAYTCIDDQGFFWNCPGCEQLFKPPAEENSSPG